ncbi:hypothetical protein PTKIN_Ptkin09bG0011900 [Pterospermum kingtungense]
MLILSFFLLHPKTLVTAAAVSRLASEQRWRSQRTTPLTTNLTRLTRMASRNPRGTATLPPKGWTQSF